MRSNRTWFRAALLSSAVALAAFPSGAQAKYRAIYSFAGQPDGSNPVVPPQADASGNLYIATSGGGVADAGAIVKFAPDGSEIVLYSFSGGADGGAPSAAVTIDRSAGDLYGTTSYGGDYGAGTIYKLEADGTFTVLHSFEGASDGNRPAGQMIRDTVGNFYGATEAGGGTGCGGYGCGTVYKYGFDGGFAVLHTFDGRDGEFPRGTLQRDKAGNFYGVTEMGGTSDICPDGCGAVYKLTPDGGFTRLYSFTGGADGGAPYGGLARDRAGNLYGTTSWGGDAYCSCGTVFKLEPDGTLTTLYTFTVGAGGAYPMGSDLLWFREKLYGTTTSGGDPTCQCGVVFRIAPDGTYRVLHAFAGSPNDGASSHAGLSRGKHGILYGTTLYGGADGNGMVFSLKVKRRR